MMRWVDLSTVILQREMVADLFMQLEMSGIIIILAILIAIASV